MALYCADVPQLPGLEAIRVRGGCGSPLRPIRWPYVAENRSFRPWIKGGELVFITGISRHRSPDNLNELIYEGVEAGIAGLVILTGDAYIGQLPQRLIRLADEQGMPLLEQPYALPMVQVTEIVSRAILEDECRDGLPENAANGSLACLIRNRLGSQAVLLELLASRLNDRLELIDKCGPTLDAWLAHGGNLSAAAQALGAHRNSVRYRLNKLYRETGLRPDRAEDLETLVMARALLRPSAEPETYPGDSA